MKKTLSQILESENHELREENHRLRQESSELRDRLAAVSSTVERLQTNQTELSGQAESATEQLRCLRSRLGALERNLD